MSATNVQVGVAALLEVCAQQRAGEVPLYHADDAARLSRTVQAEAAGRELLTALVRSEPWPGQSLGATIRRMIGYLQTVISASTPETAHPALLTVQAHHVDLDAAMQRQLRDAALCLVLAAYDDGAHDVAVRLNAVPDGAQLVVECNGNAFNCAHPALQGLQAEIVAVGGSWECARAERGQSVCVTITLTTTTHNEVSR